MTTTRLSGAVRSDDLIELTGTGSDFRVVAKAAGMHLATIPLLGDAETADHPFDRLILGLRDWRKPKPARFALITQAAFEAHDLHAYVDFRADPALPDQAEAARRVGRWLKTLLLDRRESLTLERMADELGTKLGITASYEGLRDSMAGNAPLTPGLLHAMLITLHAHKPLTPGDLAEVTAHFTPCLAGKPESGLAGLLKFPHGEIAKAYHRKQIQVAEDGQVTLAGVTVTPDITIFFAEPEAHPSYRRPYPRGGLRHVSQGDKERATAPH
jgi:hypothetical protein